METNNLTAPIAVEKRPQHVDNRTDEPYEAARHGRRLH